MKTLFMLVVGVVLAGAPALLVAEETDGAGLPPDEQRFLDELAAVMESFEGLTASEFLEQFGPRRDYRRAVGFVRGDVDGDGRIRSRDGMYILAYLFLGEPRLRAGTCDDVLDVNDDGRLTLADAVRLLQHVVLGGERPAAPFPDAGRDPTEDSLHCPTSQLLDYDPLGSENLEAVLEAFPLSEEQLEVFDEYGFVIAKDQAADRFFDLYKEIFTAHVPVYVSADAILDALHLSLVGILRTIEEEVLMARLDGMLTKLEHGVLNAYQSEGAEEISTAIDDVAIWVFTAAALLRGSETAAPESVREVVARNVQYFLWSEPGWGALIQFLERELEFFPPIGHYTETPELSRYARAVSWIQKASARPGHSPRDAAFALLLSRLFYETGADQDWRLVRGVIETMGLHGADGSVLDGASALGPGQLMEMASTAEIGSPHDFRDDNRFASFARAVNESGAGRAPVALEVLGHGLTALESFQPRAPEYHPVGGNFVADSYILENVVGPARWLEECESGPECRQVPSSLDVWYVLGNPVALPHLRAEIEEFGYHAKLGALEWIVSRYPDTVWQANVYNGWLDALRTLSEDTTVATFPGVMRTEQWAHRTLNTQLASWAQLRRDFLGYVDPPYPPMICDFPDVWVDPYPRFFLAVERLANSAREQLSQLGVLEGAPSRNRIETYFMRLASHSGTLAAIAQDELDEQPLSFYQRTFLRALLSHDTDTDRCPKTLDGWYMDMIYVRPDQETFGTGPVHATLGTGVFGGGLLQVGSGFPNLMTISVDTSCGTRAFVGPVMSYYDRTGLFFRRRDPDQEWIDALDHPDGANRPVWVQDFVR